VDKTSIGFNLLSAAASQAHNNRVSKTSLSIYTEQCQSLDICRRPMTAETTEAVQSIKDDVGLDGSR